MILTTGGLAVGEIFTKSKSLSSASRSASRELMMPSCWPSEPITLTSGSRISPLI